MQNYKIAILLSLLFIYPVQAFSQLVTESDSALIITTDYARMKIDKSNGMLISACLKDIDFEVSADYIDFSLFFTEFALQYADKTVEVFTTSNRKTHNGVVEIIDRFENATFARIKFRWTNQYIITQWSYHFFKDKKHFFINLDREVQTSWVYANHQQCIMTNPDFDNVWMVNYENEWFQTMDHGDAGPFADERAASFQHTIFTAIDNGMGVRFPGYGWYQSDQDISFGFLVTAVSPNQRAVFGYHGGGRSKAPRHPGFSEVQFDWFGKSDTEALYLRQGTKYAMQLVYFLSKGPIEQLDDLNLKLFNETHYDLRQVENYWAASWGGRHAYLAQYSWVFPQASHIYLCSQELFRHRAISIPRSQNGTADPHLFDIIVKGNIAGYWWDLTPIPQYHDSPLLHSDANIETGPDWMEGEVTWVREDMENHLAYRAFEKSDKLVVRGRIHLQNSREVHKLWMELPFSPRVRAVKKLNDFTWDVRASDTVYGTIGITLYDMQGIREVRPQRKHLELIFHEDYSGNKYGPGKMCEYAFKLFPHRGYTVEDTSQITPFYTLPPERYRDYYQTLPDLNFDNRFGVRADNRVVIYRSQLQPNAIPALVLKGYAEPGEYSLFLRVKEPLLAGVIIDQQLMDNSCWYQDPESGRLEITHQWNGPFKLELIRDIKIENFEASYQWNNIVLSWKPDFKTKSIAYHIYRKTDFHEPKRISVQPVKEMHFVDWQPTWPGPHCYELELNYFGLSKVAAQVTIEIPETWELISDNFPNPFNSRTTFWANVAQKSPVKIDIFNSQGQHVITLLDQILEPEFHSITWEGQNADQQWVPSGVYFIKAVGNGVTKTKKVLLIR